MIFFRLRPPSKRAHISCTPNSRAIILQNELLGNGTCSKTGDGGITQLGRGAQTEEIPKSC